jgi:hypothetical protein
MIIPTIFLALVVCSDKPNAAPAEMIARRDRVEAELRKTNRTLTELMSIKGVMLRLIKEPGEIRDKIGTAQDQLIEARTLDDGGQDLSVLPAYAIKLDPIRFRGLALPGGHRFTLELTWQEPTERLDTHDLTLEFDTSARKALVEGREFAALSGRDFRVLFASRVNLFVTWDGEGEGIEAVVVDGFARHRLSFRPAGGRGVVESSELVSEKVEVPPPFRPGWGGVASRMSSRRDRAADPLGRPVVIPLCDGSILVRPASSAFDDDPSLGPDDRRILADMKAWGRDIFSAGDPDQADLFRAMAWYEAVDEEISKLDGGTPSGVRQGLAQARVAAVTRMDEAAARVDGQAVKTIGVATRLCAETEAIRRQMTRYVQSSWLEKSPEFDALVREAKAVAKGGK